MIYLEHINIVVKNLENTLSFYQTAFPHWFVRGRGKQNWYGFDRNWIHFGDDYQFLTFNDNGQGELGSRENNNVGISHFAFVVSNLDDMVTRLVASGFPIYAEGVATAHRKNVYFIDPDGYEVEFVQYFSDIPSERNTYES